MAIDKLDLAKDGVLTKTFAFIVLQTVDTITAQRICNVTKGYNIGELSFDRVLIIPIGKLREQFHVRDEFFLQ